MTSVLVARAVRYARPAVRSASETLDQAMTGRVYSSTRGAVTIPHYWAVYLHDGRGPFGPTKKRVLVYFRNPRDDPRLANGYPVRAAQIRRLSRAQFYEWLARNREAIAQGLPPPMIIRKNVGPADATNFFENDGGMRGFAEEAGEVGMKLFSDHVKESLGSSFRVYDPAVASL